MIQIVELPWVEREMYTQVEPYAPLGMTRRPDVSWFLNVKSWRVLQDNGATAYVEITT